MTGITSDIENGNIMTGRDFLMSCAKACGIIPRTGAERFEPDKYYKLSLKPLIESMKKLRNESVDDARERMVKEHKREVYRATCSVIKYEAINESYRMIREQIAKWTPPNEACEELKKFALQQIDDSIYDDEWLESCAKPIYEKPDFTDETVFYRLFDEMADLTKEYERRKERYEKAVKRAESQNRVMKEFIDSLNTIEE